jgi:hypothetical protein
VSFWVSWGDSSQYAIDGMGAYFSQNYISCNGCRFPYNPQVQNPAGHILNDGSQWEVIQGSFVAQDGEAYITIGNFKNDAASNVQLVDPNHYFIVSYYFVDNISVYEIAPCIAGIDAQICPGDSSNLGIASVPGVIYSWSPTTTLNDSTIPNPVAKPQATTTYTLTQTQCNVSTTSTVTITVKTEADCTYIDRSEHVLITGATGCGKSYLACALGYQACLMGYKTLYLNMNRFCEKLALAKIDGTYLKLLTYLEKVRLLILDDFGLQQLDHQVKLALLQILEDRYQTRATIIASQLPIASWHQYLNEPTIADAIMDRVTANAHRIELKGESLRNKSNQKSA